MERFDLNQLLVYKNLVYQQSFDSEDGCVRNPTVDLSPTYNPLNFLPNPLDSDLTTSPPPEPTNLSSPLTGDDAAHVENLVYWGVDSPVLPPDILAFQVAVAEATHAFAPILFGSATMPNTPSMASFSTSSPPISPTTAPADPRACMSSSSLTSSPTESQQHTSTSSTPRPSGRAGTSYPGQSLFRLDPTVPPLKPSETPEQVKHWPHVDPNYPRCQCPLGPTKRPSRHWDVCPSNPKGRKKLFPCEICGRAFTAKWNKDRHVKNCTRREC